MKQLLRVAAGAYRWRLLLEQVGIRQALVRGMRSSGSREVGQPVTREDLRMLERATQRERNREPDLIFAQHAADLVGERIAPALFGRWRCRTGLPAKLGADLTIVVEGIVGRAVQAKSAFQVQRAERRIEVDILAGNSLLTHFQVSGDSGECGVPI